MAEPGPRAIVIGAGTMGIGIAAALLSADFAVTVIEPDDANRDSTRGLVRSILDESERRGKLDQGGAEAVAARLALAGALSANDLGPELIVEAVPESSRLKRQVLVEAEAVRPAILASNTSSLSIDGLAEALSDAQAFVGLHFFNPVAAMPLVEVVRSKATSDATVASALELVHRLGKEPIVVRDAPGFASSRLGLALGLEAIRMVEERVAEPTAIDRAMELGYRHPIGPLRLTDLVGLDVRLDIATHLAHELGPRFEPPRLLEEMVADGRLGRKSGQGFYHWE